MDELLERLETKLMRIIDQNLILHQSNQELRSAKLSLAEENKALQINQTQAVNQLHTLLTRLKALEDS